MNSHPRIVRYDELVPCRDAFIDTRTPGSDAKENFTLIGPGVSENPNQHIHIPEPHGFNIGAARQPAGCTNSQHSHDTAEVFYVHSGQWRFMLGEHGTDAEIFLSPGDLISIPTQVFRGFENVTLAGEPGAQDGFLFAVLGGDDPGRVLWAPKVFDMAKDYGLVLLDNGNLVDIGAGETVPEGAKPMPVTSAEQIATLATFDNAALRRCCVLGGDELTSATDGTASVTTLIGKTAPLDWPHGFTVERVELAPGSATENLSLDHPEVVFCQSGSVIAYVGEEVWDLGRGDTASIPRGAARFLRNAGETPATILRVRGVA